MKEKKLDNAIHEKLSGFSVAPPPQLWDGIQGQMTVMKRKKRMVYFGWISAAAVLVLALLAGWYFNNQSNKITPKMAQTEIVVPEHTESNHEDVANFENNPTENKVENTIKNQKTKDQRNILSSGAVEEQDAHNTEQLKQKHLLAENRTEEQQKDETLFFKPIERFSLNLIDNIDALFGIVPETDLKEIRKKETFIFMSEDDKNLIASNARNFEKIIQKENGWKLGMNISPGYSSHQASHTQSYAQNMNANATSGNGNVGGGFSVQYKTSKKLRIESGVYYAQNGQKSENEPRFLAVSQSSDYMLSVSEKSYLGNAVNVSNGDMMMNSTAGVIALDGAPEGAELRADIETANSLYSNTLYTSGDFSQVFDFVEIPLYLRYILVDKKIGVELIGGLNAGFVVGNNAYIDNEHGIQNVGKTEDISALNISGTVGLGINYVLGKHISVAVEPRFNYYLNSINTNAEVDYRPYRIGIFTGLYYEF